MELELHQLDLRYERLRTRRPHAERRLLGSLAENGQLVPAVVIREEKTKQYIVVDGYKRVRALRKLGRDILRDDLLGSGRVGSSTHGESDALGRGRECSRAGLVAS